MSSPGLDLRSFKIPLNKLAARETFSTRQGARLSYRLYPAWSEDLIILYHGVGSDSRYMCVLASALASSGVATVVTPDFRCHGESLLLSDEISSQQLEIDLEELIIHLKMKRSVARIILAGHSLGGGFALRMAVSETRHHFFRFVALAPYLPPALGAFQENFGGWVNPNNGGFDVNMPEAFRSGREKLHYSAAFLNAATSPDNVIERLRDFQAPVKIFTGENDEVALAQRHKQLFTSAGVSVEIVPGLNHLSIVMSPQNYLERF